MRHFIKNENGNAIVEATLLLPFCIIVIIALFYTSIFMCQKANLQANLQNALIYYKSVESDTYVNLSTDMAYESADGTVSAVGSSFGETTYKFPYRFFFNHFKKEDFKSFFRSMCGYMFFDTGENVNITANETNYVIYKKITATASQTVRPAISLSMVGLPDEITITVTGSVVIADEDEFIRDTDFVIDIVEDTAIGKKASELVDKAKEFYEKFKERFHIT